MLAGNIDGHEDAVSGFKTCALQDYSSCCVVKSLLDISSALSQSSPFTVIVRRRLYSQNFIGAFWNMPSFNDSLIDSSNIRWIHEKTHSDFYLIPEPTASA